MMPTADPDPFKYSGEQAMLLDSAQRFVREDSVAHPIGSGLRPFCRKRWRTFAELGWLGIAVPEANGGLGGSVRDVAALMEGVGPGLLPDPLLSSAIFATSVIEGVPNGPLRTKWLGRMAAGDAVAAVAHEEIGSDRSAEVRFSETAGGFRLNGVMIMSWCAAEADAIIVFARSEEADEPALFLFERGSVAIVESYPLLDGSMAADIRFDHVQVDNGALLARGRGAQAAFDAALDRAIVAHAAMIIGVARDAMHMTSEYLKTRVQFGGPIARFQALQHRVAEMFVHYQDAVSALHFAIQACEQDDPVQRATMVSAAKVVIGDAVKYIGSQAVQLHGAIGVTEEYRIGHYYRKILVFLGMYGDASFHLARYEELRSEEAHHEH